MTTRQLPLRLTAGAALLLGHASVLWGLGSSISYFGGFVLLVSEPSPGMLLPFGIPAIGLALGALGGVLAVQGGEPATRSPWIGLALNGLALAFAVGLRLCLA